MQKALFQLPPVKQTKHKTRRGELISAFLDALNPPRKEAGYPPYTYPRIARMVSHLDDFDLACFLGSCKEAKNFSSFYHWALKV